MKKNIKKETIHIIGIGGIGMSAIAEILHNSNYYKVQGSDIQLNDNVNRLQKLGIKIYIGHNVNNIKQAQIVSYSSAIKSHNIELLAARNSNKTILCRSDILCKIMKDKYVIAVSGSSGKTTTTAIIASIFDYSGIDATVIAGGILNSYQNNSKLGNSNVFLIEADESDGTMLKIPTNIAVITSINNDHIDYYGTFDNIKNAFFQFINRSDFVILPEYADINHDIHNSITFGFENISFALSYESHIFSSLSSDINNKISDFRIFNNKKEKLLLHSIKINSVKAVEIKQNINNVKFDVLINNKYKIKNVILSNVIGIHKVSNALAAISVAIKLGISSLNIKKGLLEFKGVLRRFSLIANIRGIKLIEDYSHHPNEIKATLVAARMITKGKVIGIIELLRFTRIHNFFFEFIKAFMMFDYIVLTSVYPIDDKPILGCKIDDIKNALLINGFSNVKIMNDAFLISDFIKKKTNPGDIVLFIGAGSNIAKLAKESVELISKIYG